MPLPLTTKVIYYQHSFTTDEEKSKYPQLEGNLRQKWIKNSLYFHNRTIKGRSPNQREQKEFNFLFSIIQLPTFSG